MVIILCIVLLILCLCFCTGDEHTSGQSGVISVQLKTVVLKRPTLILPLGSVNTGIGTNVSSKQEVNVDNSVHNINNSVYSSVECCSLPFLVAVLCCSLLSSVAVLFCDCGCVRNNWSLTSESSV